MSGFLFAPENIIFVSAFALMLVIGLVQAMGLGGDADLNLDGDADLLGWLGFGHLPLLALIALFLTLFSVIGLIGQQAAHDLIGAMLSPWIAVPVAGALALPPALLLLLRCRAPVARGRLDAPSARRRAAGGAAAAAAVWAAAAAARRRPNPRRRRGPRRRRAAPAGAASPRGARPGRARALPASGAP